MIISKSVFKKLGMPRDASQEALPSMTSIGFYPIVYLNQKCDAVCACCARQWNDEDNPIIIADVYYEGEPIECDCGETIESAYG